MSDWSFDTVDEEPYGNLKTKRPVGRPPKAPEEGKTHAAYASKRPTNAGKHALADEGQERFLDFLVADYSIEDAYRDAICPGLSNPQAHKRALKLLQRREVEDRYNFLFCKNEVEQSGSNMKIMGAILTCTEIINDRAAKSSERLAAISAKAKLLGWHDDKTAQDGVEPSPAWISDHLRRVASAEQAVESAQTLPPTAESS